MAAADLQLVSAQATKLIQKVGADGAGVALFTKLFQKNPKLVDRFVQIKQAGAPYDGTNAALKEHGEKIVKNLLLIVSMASNPSKFEQVCMENAKRHKPLKATKADFDFVRDCLLEVLDSAMGSDVDCAAWGRVYDAVSSTTLKLVDYPHSADPYESRPLIWFDDTSGYAFVTHPKHVSQAPKSRSPN